MVGWLVFVIFIALFFLFVVILGVGGLVGCFILRPVKVHSKEEKII